jgi:hypothetical protein
MKKNYHEVNLKDLGESLAEINESLYKMYIQIAMFAGHKILGLICGPETAKILVNLPGDQKQLQELEFYKMGYNGITPIYVDMSLGAGDILVVCKTAIEKIRVKDLHG